MHTQSGREKDFPCLASMFCIRNQTAHKYSFYSLNILSPHTSFSYHFTSSVTETLDHNKVKCYIVSEHFPDDTDKEGFESLFGFKLI